MNAVVKKYLGEDAEHLIDTSSYNDLTLEKLTKLLNYQKSLNHIIPLIRAQLVKISDTNPKIQSKYDELEEIKKKLVDIVTEFKKLPSNTKHCNFEQLARKSGLVTEQDELVKRHEELNNSLHELRSLRASLRKDLKELEEIQVKVEARIAELHNRICTIGNNILPVVTAPPLRV